MARADPDAQCAVGGGGQPGAVRAGQPEVVAAPATTLTDPDSDVRRTAASLGRLEQASPEIVAATTGKPIAPGMDNGFRDPVMP